MDKKLQTPRITRLATTGVGHFGEAGEEGAQIPLFRVVAGLAKDGVLDVTHIMRDKLL